MNQATYEALDASATSQYAKANGGTQASFDILSLIMTILQTVLSGGFCPTPTPAGLKNMAKNPSKFQAFLLQYTARSAIRSQFGPAGWSKVNGPAVMTTALEMGKALDEPTLGAAMDFVTSN